MASSNKTNRLKLPQWVGSDKPTMDDFNDAFEKIDGVAIEKTGTDPNFCIRFPNGVQLCYLYVAGMGQGGIPITFASPFASVPHVSGTDHSGDANQMRLINVAYTTNTSASVYPMTGFNQRSATDGPVTIFAMGRWK